MKKVGMIAVLMLIAFFSQAQNLSQVNGLYVDASGNAFTGIHKTHFENGTVKATYTIENGLMNGLAVLFYMNGQKMEAGNYVAGERDGLWENWNESGLKTSEANFTRGIKNGRWLVWDSKGTKRSEMFYCSGKKCNTWSMWDESGSLLNQKAYTPEQ